MTSICFVLLIFVNVINAIEFEASRLTQEILVEPDHVIVHAGETVQLPCIVSKQSDAIVTWCWNDFCTLGKTQFVRHENSVNDQISIYQYSAYPRFQLRINERLSKVSVHDAMSFIDDIINQSSFCLDHYNLSITHVSDRDEGTFQCQIQRTMRAFEARSRRVHLTLITPPTSSPILEFAELPFRQGQSTNITCLSSPSKPAAILFLYKNDEKLDVDSSSTIISHQIDVETQKNQTKFVYLIDDPDINWDESIIRCEQIYPFVNVSRQSVSKRIRTLYKPKVRIESQNRNPLTVNSTATFRCVANGNPEAKIRWFANSMDLSSLTSPIINIPLSKHVHNHTIGCMAMNEIGTTNSTIRLLIRYPPIIFLRPPKFVVIDLERKSTNPSIVRCVVDAFPRPKISWLYQGEIVGVGPFFHLTNITKRDQQGVYSYRIESDGFETIVADFIIHVKGRPLVFIEESKEDRRTFECRVYSSTPILKITWKFNDQSIESIDRSSISTICNEYSCISKLITDQRQFVSSTTSLSHLLCLAENQFGTEQSRLYQIDTTDDLSFVLISIIFSCFVLIVICSILIIIFCCRSKRRKKRQDDESIQSPMPIVFDEHYSINELIKEVGSFRTCNTSTNSSGFHSKSTTTIFPSEHSPQLLDLSFYQMNV